MLFLKQFLGHIYSSQCLPIHINSLEGCRRVRKNDILAAKVLSCPDSINYPGFYTDIAARLIYGILVTAVFPSMESFAPGMSDSFPDPYRLSTFSSGGFYTIFVPKDLSILKGKAVCFI